MLPTEHQQPFWRSSHTVPSTLPNTMTHQRVSEWVNPLLLHSSTTMFQTTCILLISLLGAFLPHGRAMLNLTLPGQHPDPEAVAREVHRYYLLPWNYSLYTYIYSIPRPNCSVFLLLSSLVLLRLKPKKKNFFT